MPHSSAPPPRRPELIAHRGAPRERPENTLAAFQRALELGADAIELDVHVTADGTPVVHHDPTLEPEGAPIVSMALDRLLSEAAVLGREVPTLAAVLDLPGAHGVYVELKGARTAHAAVHALRASSARHRCAIHSFDHWQVRMARQLDSRIPGGILLTSYLVDNPSALRAAGARDLWMWWELIDRSLIAAVQELGGRVIAWTVNSAAAAASLVRMGVDGLCTDDIPLIRAACDDITRT